HGLLAGIRPKAGAVPMYSTVTGELVDGERLVPAYWGKNLRDQVRLMPAVERAMADGHDVFVEISPHPVILPSIGQIAGARGAEVTALPALRRDEERGAFASTLGELYELGRPVDFASLYPAGGRVVSLPGYAWQRERYEFTPAKGRARTARAGSHDLLGARTPVAAERETYVWPVELSLEAAPYLTDHRVLGSVVVPGALYVDLALSAGAQIFGQVSLEEVVFERVLPLPEDGAREAQVTLTVLDAERASFTVSTLYDAEGGARPTWTRHASGTVRAGRVTTPAPLPIAEIRARAPRRVEGEAYYRFTSSLGIQLGPLFRGVERLECNDTEGLATVRLEEPVSAMLSRYTLHPAFLDIVFQAMGGPISGTGLSVAAGDTCLPVRLERLRVHEPVHAGQRVYSHASVRPAQKAGSYLADIVLLAEDGRALLEVEGLHLEPVNGVGAKGARGAAPADPIDALTYGLEWVEAPRTERRTAPGAWLVAGASGPAAELAAALGARGQSAIALPEGADLVAHALPAPDQPLSLVYLAGASADAEQALADDRPAADVEAVARWVRAVSKAGFRQAPRLFLVTFEARRVVELDAVRGLAQAPLLGLGATLRHEHAELRATSIDVARAGIGALADELIGADDETEIALRESRWALRLVRAPLAPSASPKAPVRPDGTYLITGGLTGIGLTVARWLAEQGARDLVLVARRPPSPEARAVIDAIAERGARVHVRACDVTDRAAVSALFGEVRRELPPLRGVAHCAVVLDDATLLNLDGERLRKVMAPKVAGAWNLHRETRDLSLDFFHLYSSVASLFGSPGQGNYAAGSAFLDALAHYRRAAGLPATAINWGPWAEIGLAAADEKRGERVAGRGAASLTPELGLAALGRLLAAEAPPQIGLLSFDLRQWAEFYPAAARTPLFARLRDEAGSAPAAHAALRDELLAAPAPLRKGLLEKHLSEQVGRVLRMPPSRVQRQKAFNTMGVDSLMALEIRNRLEGSLGLTLPAILLYAHPSVAALAAHLLTHLEQAAPAPAPAPALAPAPPAAAATAAPAVEAMTDEQAEAALLTQLAALGMKTAP
ncbi:MAG TPA: SDR family NAD(P)-dependent oxidoreductase, partial [Polyangiaceae bacterium]|nr:SDR family NAD(P)-dependent oxidoreductase [Polyangiaceae bacterium]